MNDFRVPPPDGERPGCVDALILNVAVFTALPSGLLTVVLVAWSLPEWVGRDYGLWLAFGLGVPAIVVLGLLYHRGLYALLNWARRVRAQRHSSPWIPPLAKPAPPRQDLGTMTIKRGDWQATLRVAEAAWTWVDHPGGAELIFYVSAPVLPGDAGPLDEEGAAHPGAWLRVILPISPWSSPDRIVAVRNLEDPHFHVPWREGIPASVLFDYEMSTVVRFGKTLDHDKSDPHLTHWNCRGRTAGGPGGDPPPIQFSISCRFHWNGKVNLGDRSWQQLLADLARND